jgi:hypothetical protein
MDRKGIALWTIAGSLTALLLVAKATPNATPPTPTHARPMSLARICPTIGAYAAAVATSRDAGTPLNVTLSVTRQDAAAQGMERTMQAILEEIVQQVYRYPAITPRQVYQVAERACMETQTGTAR